MNVAAWGGRTSLLCRQARETEATPESSPMIKFICISAKAGHDHNILQSLPVPSPSMPGMSSPNLGEKRAGKE